MPFLALFYNPKIILIALVVLAALGYLSFQEIRAANLRSEIAVLMENQIKLEQSNASLSNANINLRENNRLILDEIANIRQSDAQSRSQLSATNARLRSSEQRAAILASRNSNPIQFIDTVNRNYACELANFGRLGSCVNGTFIAGNMGVGR